MMTKAFLMCLWVGLLFVGVAPANAEENLCEAPLPRHPAVEDLMERARVCVDIYYQPGQYRYTTNNYDSGLIFRAKARFEHLMALAVSLDPTNADVYWLRAEGRRQMFEYELAIEDYTTLIELGKATAAIYFARAQMYYELRFSDENAIAAGIDDLTIAMTLAPEDVDIALMRAKLDYLAGDEDQAYFGFAHVLMLDPNNGEAYLYLGDIYYDREQYDVALAAYKLHLTFGPERNPRASTRIILIQRDLEEP